MTQMVAFPAQIPSSFEEVQRLAELVAKSGLFGTMNNPTQVLALMLLSQAEGVHPMIAARDYHIINGKPSLKADAMQARFQAAGGRVDFEEKSDERCSATFSIEGHKPVTIEWDMARAKRAGLLKNPMWERYSRQMLRARVISEGVRTLLPGVCCGIYVKEEQEDIAAEKPSKNRLKEIAAAEVIEVEDHPPALEWNGLDNTVKAAVAKYLVALTRESIKRVDEPLKTMSFNDSQLGLLRSARNDATTRIKEMEAAEKASREKAAAERAATIEAMAEKFYEEEGGKLPGLQSRLDGANRELVAQRSKHADAAYSDRGGFSSDRPDLIDRFEADIVALTRAIQMIEEGMANELEASEGAA